MSKKISTVILYISFMALSLTACGDNAQQAVQSPEEVVDSSEANAAEGSPEDENQIIIESERASQSDDVTLDDDSLASDEETNTDNSSEAQEIADSGTASAETTGAKAATVNTKDTTANTTAIATTPADTYTFTDMSATKYAKSNVNVRDLPNTDGNKLGGLNTNDEITVTGQCNETGWYRFEYNGETAYVSDSYLVDTKVDSAQVSTNSQASTSTSNDSLPEFPYQLVYIYGSAEEGFTVYGNKRQWSKEDYELGLTRDERYPDVRGGDSIIQAYNMMLNYLSSKFYETEGSNYYYNHYRDNYQDSDGPDKIGPYKDVGYVYVYKIWWE